jgi:hypothetical protein
MRCLNKSYFDGNRWERLISEKIPLLIEFIVHYNDAIHDYFAIYLYHPFIHRFTLQFSTEQGWTFRMTIKKKHH